MTAGEENRIEVYPPGSKFALEHGCSCAVMDNHRGAGRYGDGKKYGWFMTQDCKLHGWTDEADQ